MRYLLLVCLLGFAIAFDLVVFLSTFDDSLEPFDPLHPATLVPIVAARAPARNAAARAEYPPFFDALAAPYRERLQHESPTSPRVGN